MKKAFVVYQNGIANVFEVKNFNLSDYKREAKRLNQGTFSDCESFARGLVHAGYKVASAYCTKLGDIAKSDWEMEIENAPFFDAMNPVWNLDNVIE